MTKLPAIRPYNLAGVFKLKDSLLRDMEPHIGVVMSGESLRLMSGALLKRLPKDVESDLVYESVRHLGGIKLSWAIIRLEAWRLAGNVRRLKSGHPVKPWRRQESQEWIPAQVVDCRAIRTKRGELGAIFTSRVLAGTSCTLLLEYFWPLSFCKLLSSYMGYSPPWGKYTFSKMDELIGLRFYAFVKPAKILEPKKSPEFAQVKVTGSLKKYNQSIIMRRARHKFRCPLDYRHACYRCHVGYDKCSIACHPRSFVKALCDACDETTWIDPEFMAIGLCVSCRAKRDLQND